MFFIGLSWFHNPCLTRVDSSFFFCHFIIDFFYNFILQYWVDWSIDIFFNLFSIKLSWSHDPSYKFCMLIWVDPDRSNIMSFQFFFKKYFLEFFIIQTIFFFLLIVQVVFKFVKLTGLYRINTYTIIIFSLEHITNT